MTNPQDEAQGPTNRHPEEVATDVHVEPKKKAAEKVDDKAAADDKVATAKTTPSKSEK